MFKLMSSVFIRAALAWAEGECLEGSGATFLLQLRTSVPEEEPAQVLLGERAARRADRQGEYTSVPVVNKIRPACWFEHKPSWLGARRDKTAEACAERVATVCNNKNFFVWADGGDKNCGCVQDDIVTPVDSCDGNGGTGWGGKVGLYEIAAPTPAPSPAPPAPAPEVTCAGLQDGEDLKCNGEDVSLGSMGKGNFNLCERACEREIKDGVNVEKGTLGCCKFNNRNGACSFTPDDERNSGKDKATLRPANNPTRHAVLCTIPDEMVASTLGELDEMVLLGPGSCVDHSAMTVLDEKSSALLEKSEAGAKNKLAETITLLEHYRGHALDLSVDSCKAKCVDTPQCSYASFFKGPQPSSPTECKLYTGIPCGLAPSETDQEVVTYGRPSWYFDQE